MLLRCRERLLQAFETLDRRLVTTFRNLGVYFLEPFQKLAALPYRLDDLRVRNRPPIQVKAGSVPICVRRDAVRTVVVQMEKSLSNILRDTRRHAHGGQEVIP